MKKGQNWNRPEPGGTIKVVPIKRTSDIKAIKKIPADNPRHLALFTVGINTNLRASDLLRITAGIVRDLEPGDSFELEGIKDSKVAYIGWLLSQCAKPKTKIGEVFAW